MKLTIAIPTYDRAADLAELLSTIAQDIAALEPNLAAQLEVLVSDNASPASTRDVVERLAPQMPQLRALHNETNIGMQANFLQCINSARGAYIWMIGDDEILEPGGLARVLSAIDRYATPLLVFNYSSEPSPVGEPFLKSLNGVPLQTSVHQTADFVLRSGWLWTMGNLGMVVAETARVRGVDPAPHMASCFAQAGWYFEAFHDAPMAFVHETVIRTKLSSQTQNKQRWKADGTSESMHFLVDSIAQFVRRGLIPARVPVMFLNACSCNRMPIWNYFLQGVVTGLTEGNFQVADREWTTMAALVDLVDDPELRGSMDNYLGALRRSIVATQASRQNAIWVLSRVHSQLHLAIA